MTKPEEIIDWPPDQVYTAICKDFETEWNGVGATQDGPNTGRGISHSRCWRWFCWSGRAGNVLGIQRAKPSRP